MKIDGRTLSHEASETIRRMAVKRVLEGESPSAVMKSYGLCRTTIYPWLRAHKKSGEAALQSRPSTGRPPMLSDREQRQVHRLLPVSLTRGSVAARRPRAEVRVGGWSARSP